MTTELKTLKHITKCCDCTCIDEVCPDYVELRKEAIKWIKLIENTAIHRANKEIALGFYYSINWIKHFFNITEEELK